MNWIELYGKKRKKQKIAAETVEHKGRRQNRVRENGNEKGWNECARPEANAVENWILLFNELEHTHTQPYVHILNKTLFIFVRNWFFSLFFRFSFSALSRLRAVCLLIGCFWNRMIFLMCLQLFYFHFLLNYPLRSHSIIFFASFTPIFIVRSAWVSHQAATETSGSLAWAASVGR